MKVLVACEESQRVCSAFRERGHEAYSCDIQEPSGGHPEWHVLGDVLKIIGGGMITTMDGVEHYIGKWDMMIAHPPCFVAGTMIMTENGSKPIEDIQIGDKVLTHKGRYKPVTNVMSKSVSSIVDVHTENCGHIKCTDNHPFYTTQISKAWDDTKRVYSRQIGDFEWKPPIEFIQNRSKCGAIKDITGVTSVSDNIKQIPVYNGCFIGKNAFSRKHVNTLQISNPCFWYFVGRWLGDGWHCYKKKGRTHGYYGVIICCALDDDTRKQLRQAIELAGLKYWESKSRTCYRFEIDNKELSNFMLQFGDKAYGKHLTYNALHLPDNLAIALLNGYFDSDGHITQSGAYSFSTVSKRLAYDIKYVINKYYKVSCSIYEHDNSRGSTIEGRKCNVRTAYVGQFRKDIRKQSHFIVRDNYIIANYKRTEPINVNTTVYNLSVADDESYTANGLVVHNCTYLSNAGACRLYPKKGQLDQERYQKGLQAKEFFMKFFNADIGKIAVENPIPSKVFEMPPYTQIIQPYEYGHPYTKKTCLWLKGLPKLIPTNIVKPIGGYVCGNSEIWKRQAANGEVIGKEKSPKHRSKTFEGIAKAFASQWGGDIRNDKIDGITTWE